MWAWALFISLNDSAKIMNMRISKCLELVGQVLFRDACYMSNSSKIINTFCFISTLQPVSWSWELRSSEVYIFPYGRKKAPKPRQVAFHFMFINFAASFFQMKCVQPVGMTWVHFFFRSDFFASIEGKNSIYYVVFDSTKFYSIHLCSYYGLLIRLWFLFFSPYIQTFCLLLV